MAISTSQVSGLASGFDWLSIIDQLYKVEHQRVDLVSDKKTEYEAQLSEWLKVNTMLLSLKTAAGALSTESAFNVYTASTSSNTTTSASNLLTVSTSSSASPSTYNIKVNNIAQSEKISSKNYTDTVTALGLSGDILISGKVVNIASTDTLADIKGKINAVNTGSSPSNVTTSIISQGSNNYHLVLTSDETGEGGLNILEGAYSGGDNILQEMGFIGSSTTIKTRTSDGAKSDLFGNSNEAIGSLLELSSAPGSTTVKIGGLDIDIDLFSQSLATIAENIDELAGISASVVSETVDGEMLYRIDISGTTSFTDSGNVLQTLGIIEGTYGTVAEVHAGTAALTDASDTLIDNDNGNLNTNLIALKIGGTSAGVQNGDTISISGKKSDGTSVSSIDFKVGTDGNTVQDLMTFIEDQYTGEDNTVTVSFEDGKITITADTAGDSRMEVSLISNNENSGILDFGEISMVTEGRSMQISAGEDAEIEVDNVVITDSSNTITGLIEGVTLNLVGENTDTTITVKVERDLETIKSNINDLADAYNAIMNYINTQFSYDQDNEEAGGTLFGDGTLSSVKSDLISMVTQTVTGVSGDFNRLPLIGISLDLSDTDEGSYEKLNMSIDEDALAEALETNFDDVKKLLIAYGSSPSSNLEYVNHTSDTQAGTYNVNITQPATRTTVTGSEALLATLGEVVTVSITDYKTGRTAEVELDADLDIDDVVNAINSELAEEYTEQLVGNGENKDKDLNYITSSTLFSNITGGDDDDEITFSGTRRSGIYVTGSYKIEDASIETVGDLLETIEDMFENEVTASMDANGKIVITDKQAGDSQLTFTINTDSITGLNFGSVSTATEGRYAMQITASEGTGADANKLVLTHNNYGTGNILTVSQESEFDPLGLDDAAQVYGKDVEGTINSLTATGSGRILTLDSDGNNADGLSISYSGSGTIATTFTLTLGIAKLLDRKLTFITDITDGYVTYKQTSIQDSIDSLETRVEEMEARLDIEMATLMNQFLAMELALSQMQSQSQWLAGQVTASFSGWGLLG